jgi:hypothetical protein
LFWVVELPDDGIEFSDDARRGSVHAEDVAVVDSFQFGGPNNVPAKVSFSLEWRAIGPARELGEHGKPVPPNAPSAFSGNFARGAGGQVESTDVWGIDIGR